VFLQNKPNSGRYENWNNFVGVSEELGSIREIWKSQRWFQRGRGKETFLEI
jgi:hypothetical protein